LCSLILSFVFGLFSSKTTFPSLRLTFPPFYSFPPKDKPFPLNSTYLGFTNEYHFWKISSELDLETTSYLPSPFATFPSYFMTNKFGITLIPKDRLFDLMLDKLY